MPAGRPFLFDLDPLDAGDLKRLARIRRVEAGQSILPARGGRHVGVLLAGHARVSAHTGDGRDLLLEVRGPGDLVGNLGTTTSDDQVHQLAVAVSDVSVALLSAREFTSFLAARPRAALAFIRSLVFQLERAQRAHADLVERHELAATALRVLQLVEQEGRRTADGVTLELPSTADEMCALIGAPPDTVRSALRLLRSLGWIAQGSGSVLALARGSTPPPGLTH